MSARLDGKVAIVTGAAGDLGSAAVALMLERGAAVVAADPDAAGLQRLPTHARLVAMRADVAQEADLAACVARAQMEFGRLDILFNNPGESPRDQRIPDLAREDFDAVFTRNARGAFLAMKQAIPVLVASGGGSIINFAGEAALRAGPGQLASAASQAAVIGLTRTAALEWGERGIRVNCIVPAPCGGAATRDGHARKPVAGRPGSGEALAPVVCFLASDAASFVTGAVYGAEWLAA